MDLDSFRNLVLVSELMAAIFGTIYFGKYKNTPLKYFLFLLWYIIITELTAGYASSSKTLGFINSEGIHFNYWFYNLLRIVTFSTMFYVYYQSVSTVKFKKWIKLFTVIYGSMVIVNWSFLQNFAFEMSELPRILGSIFLIVSIIFYLIELLRSEKIILYHRILLFWISVGFLLFYSGTIPFALKYNGYALIPGIHKLFLIIYILAILMYLIFTFGFIWSKKE